MVARKVASRKSKGRNLQNFIVTELRKRFVNNQFIFDEDIKPAIMGESGVDIKLTPTMKQYLEFDIESKNQENWSIPSWWKQTLANTEEGRKPLLVVKKNRSEPLVVMRFNDWLELI